MSLALSRGEDRKEAPAFLTRALKLNDIALDNRYAGVRRGVAVQPPRA